MHVPVTPLGIEKVLHGHLPAADDRTGIVVFRLHPTAADQRDKRARDVLAAAAELAMPAVLIDDLPEGHPLLAGAIALQLITLELVHLSGTNPDLIRREEEAYKAAAAAASHVTGAPLALLASLLWGTADFLAGRTSRTHPAVMVAFIGQATGLVCLAVVIAFHGLDTGAFLPGAISGVFGVVAIVVFYRALALGTMSVVAPIVATSAIVPVIAGVVDGERPGTLQWIGVVAALAGVILASREPGGVAEDQRAALRLAVIAAVGIGFALVFLGAAADHDALYRRHRGADRRRPVLGLLVLQARARAPVGRSPTMAGIGVLDTGANTAFAIATTGGLLSLVSVLGGLFPIVTVALAYFLLHERLQRHQRIGVALALTGIPLISA